MCFSGGGKSEKPSDSGAVKPCPEEDPCGKDAISNVTKCCGSEILEEAKKANGGKTPNIVFGEPPKGFDGVTDLSTGTITVRNTGSKCTDTETVFFELSNMAAKPKFDAIHKDALAGNLGREDFTKAEAKVEYDNVRKAQAATDKCKEKWGCKSHTFDFDSTRPAKDFDDYYDHYSTEHYKDYYRKAWDDTYKSAYEAKHPKAGH